MRASERSTLFTTTMMGSCLASALRSTNRVWGSGPSDASTRRITPSTISRPRSTSPPKSAWPGVSMMLMTASVPSGRRCLIAVFFARIVMPFSRSRSIESITRASMSAPSRNAPDCHSIESTSVVFPWSTWAMMATFRRSSRVGMGAPHIWAVLSVRAPGPLRLVVPEMATCGAPGGERPPPTSQTDDATAKCAPPADDAVS